MKTLLLVALLLAAPAAYGEPALRRYAIIVSSNDGGADRTKLRYADSDASSIADVLRELGGLHGDDLLLVPNATRARIEAAFAALRTKLAAKPAGLRGEIIVYYSGHSDEQGLLLAGERIGYRELRGWIDGTSADVRIAILDSCASGALIRRRGGTHTASFLGDRSVDARGHAFLTASSADEAAQESDRIGAAFFTHYFVSGLRGAADINRDGTVTLNEAYQFAYHETLRRTEQTASGPQHAAYDIQLAGIGDLVLTDLRATTASLQLDDDLSGRVYVRDATGRLVAELQKYANVSTALALAPGTYTVMVEQGRTRRVATVDVRARVRVGATQLSIAPIQPATARGGEVAGRTTALASPDWRALGGYAGLFTRYSRLGGRDGFNPGMEIAVRYRAVSFGLVGGAVVTEGPRSLTLGYGGFVGRYNFYFGRAPYYLSIGAIAAAGGIETDDDTSDDPPDAAAWIFEPQVVGYLDLTRWLRLGFDAGYRFVAASGDGHDMHGFGFGVTAQLGWF
jgi:hypothetical protein